MEYFIGMSFILIIDIKFADSTLDVLCEFIPNIIACLIGIFHPNNSDRYVWNVLVCI